MELWPVGIAALPDKLLTVTASKNLMQMRRLQQAHAHQRRTMDSQGVSMKHHLLVAFAALVVFASTQAGAVDKPMRKPGLWETTVQAGGKTFVSQVCVDAATEAKNNAATDEYMKANCSKYDFRREGAKWITDSVCTFGGTQTVGHTVTTAIGDSAFHTDGTTIADSKWLGPCLVGQKPGVVMMDRSRTK
ncbi:MAG: DUF3617 family protein [Betaproteobacteria bacterium]